MNQLIKKYFEHFSNQNIQMLKKMFSKNIILKDWETKADGYDQVVEANLKIFNSVDSIKVLLIDYFEKDKDCICLIEILINEKDILKVIDVIKFDDQNLIKEISAYKQ
jgi:hypothetical protein